MLMISVYRSKLESTVQEEQKKMTSLKSQLDDSKRKEKEFHSNVASAKKDSEDKKRLLGQRNCDCVICIYVLLHCGIPNGKL